MQTSGKVRSADGTTIAFDRSGAGPALIMVDAAGCFRAFGPMQPLATELAAHFTVYRYDRRGRGESTDTPPYAVEREVDDLRALIEQAGGSALVYGFSSGAVLALHAAARGAAIDRLALLEPPLVFDDDPEPDTDLEAEIAALVAEGRRGEAIEHFNASIGVPADMIAGLRGSPFWPSLEALAHTLVYDCVITRTLRTADLAAITTPTLILNSQDSTDNLRTWARRTAEVLPNGRHLALPGEWHTIPAETLAPAIVAFFT